MTTESKNCMTRPHSLIIIVFTTLLITSCNTQFPETCPSSLPIGLLEADEIANDDSLPFRLPLDESATDAELYYGWFGASNECPPDMEDCYEYPENQFHAAEDYKRPAGTPVYAMADGRISYSDPAGGYGWLIIIDHPQANLYSLYGHLSPSRWKQEAGKMVKKGDLIAYLGDPDENGGSKENPLDPHLHFGIRAGQMADYPSRGEWRYMAGWIRLCPQDLGWLQPSLIITSQNIPPGGYLQPEVGFLTRWGVELIIICIYALCGSLMLYYAVRKNVAWLFFFPGAMVTLAGIVMHNNSMQGTYALLFIGIGLTALGTVLYARRHIGKRNKPAA